MDAKTELERRLVGLAPGMETEIRQVLEAYRITWAETGGALALRGVKPLHRQILLGNPVNIPSLIDSQLRIQHPQAISYRITGKRRHLISVNSP